MSAAGLSWHVDVGGVPTRCFVVITTEARDASGEVHDRMPAFLTPDLRDEWVSPASLTVKGDATASKQHREALVGELASSAAVIAQTIREHIVDRRVNSIRGLDRSNPELIEQVE